MTNVEAAVLYGGFPGGADAYRGKDPWMALGKCYVAVVQYATCPEGNDALPPIQVTFFE